MQIPAIVMAGGRGKRFNFNKIDSKIQEKLLLLFGGKYIIEYVIDAAINSKNINRVIIATSPHTTQTKSFIESKKMAIELFETPGNGYHSDLQYVIKNFGLGVVMSIVADIPLTESEFIDSIIDKYYKSNKPALSVMTNIKSFVQNGLEPTITIQPKNNHETLVPLGINIIDGRFIDYPEIEETIFITDKKELLFNINTAEDYDQLKKFFNTKYP